MSLEEPDSPRIPWHQAGKRCSRCFENDCLCTTNDEHPQSVAILPAQYTYDDFLTSPCAPPISPIDSLRTKYVFKLENGQVRARFWLHSGAFNYDTTLGMAVARLGRNNALDDAVRCISESGDVVGQGSYVTALNSLRNVLQDPTLSKTSETLAAATILYNHEIYLDPKGSSWNTHAKGLIQLLQYYGANNISGDLDRSTIIGNIGTILTISVTSRQPCFLADPCWRMLLQESIDMINEIEKGSFPEDVKRIILASIHLPGLLCRYQIMASADDLDNVKQLIREISSLHTELQECRTQYNDRQPWQVLEDEIAKGKADPVSATSQMSADIFIIISDYMLFNLRSRCAIDQDAPVGLPPGTFTTVNRWTLLASQAKIKWLALNQLDVISARACAACPKSVIRWVLEPPHTESAEVQSIRLILQDLYRCLKPAT